ncbi:MAG: 3-phosphoshikimate 1-carboxyvinyltransferase [Chloroflexota bacterium]|nr:3-phosphoshikimate 1-carboxyvinyltransferase [Chloroflexota bacterium]
MIDPLPIEPLRRPPDATVTVPGSKSYTNRALLVAAMADGHSVIDGALFSDDTERMADSLRRLGLRVEADAKAARFDVWGSGGAIPTAGADLFVGNAGTAARFLLAFVALGHGRYRLDGDPRMRLRPQGPLLAGLGQLGVAIAAEERAGCLPVSVQAAGIEGGTVTMDGSQSSQYFSALLMVGPLTRRGMEIHVEGELVSKPYIDLTADVMRTFGATVERDADYRTLRTSGGQRYQARAYTVEPDASNASYFLAAAALTGGRVRVNHLGRSSVQGDLQVLDAFAQMGCTVARADDHMEVRGPAQLRGIAVDANAYADMALTLCALAPFAEGPTEVRNITHVREQECDRIDAAVTELRRLGQEVEEYPDGLRITPRPIQPATIETYDDHRVAMAFALVGLRVPGIAIANPSCTAKTFPEYWDCLDALRA